MVGRRRGPVLGWVDRGGPGASGPRFSFRKGNKQGAGGGGSSGGAFGRTKGLERSARTGRRKSSRRVDANRRVRFSLGEGPRVEVPQGFGPRGSEPHSLSPEVAAPLRLDSLAAKREWTARPQGFGDPGPPGVCAPPSVAAGRNGLGLKSGTGVLGFFAFGPGLEAGGFPSGPEPIAQG